MIAAQSTEVDLLLQCSRTNIVQTASQKIKSLASGSLDWDFLISTAEKHRLQPILYWNLNSICPEAVPKDSLKSLKDVFYTNCCNNLFLAEELIRLLDLFNSKQIEAVPFKGPVLSVSAYGNLSLRQFSDLDIFIHKDNFQDVKNLLISQGYAPAFQFKGVRDSIFLRSNHAYNFVHVDNQRIVEVHWRFVPKNFFSLNFTALWKNLQFTILAGEKVSTFPVEETFLILCVHGAKHCWNRLDYICDIAELIQAHDEIDWRRLLSQADELGVKKMVLLAFSLTHFIFGTDIPKSILKTLQSDSSVKILTKKVCECLFPEPNESYTELSRLPFHLSVNDTVLYKLKYFFRFVFTPTFEDWMFLQLPAKLYPLYSPFRPIRLFLIQPILQILPQSLRIIGRNCLNFIKKMLKPMRVQTG